MSENVNMVGDTLQIDAVDVGSVVWNTKQSTTGTVTGFTVGTGTAVESGSTFTGNTGSTAYTIGDIVLALKNVGILAQ